jgi:site-specific DNA-methyltransferase (adenine-specific)
MTPRNTILTGDARTILPTLAPASIDCVITSPPYFQLRDYAHDDQIGLEGHVDAWVAELAAISDTIARVLAPHGALWINVGDSYSRHARHGGPAKSLLLAPERLALELARRGWIIRNRVAWTKPNPMPSSVKDRLTCAWEVIYFATRNPGYYFDLDAVRIPHRSQPPARRSRTVTTDRPDWVGPLAGTNSGLDRMKAAGHAGHALGKNPGDVWNIPTSNYRGGHHATFPRRLIERPLLATCPERVCNSCGLPWRRTPHRQLGHLAVAGHLEPACTCRAGHRPGLVLDPFMGAGTVALAAQEHGRDWLGIELNPDYVALATDRITRDDRRAA